MFSLIFALLIALSGTFGSGRAAAAEGNVSVLRVEGARGGGKAVLVREKVYDYSPSAMKDENNAGIYRMWWCGGVAGDHILHAEATSLAGPWHARGSTVPNSFDDTFAPTYNTADFDGQHVCDPSVVRVNGTYWLYYGGYPKWGSSQPMNTAVGVAKSTDGLKFTRVQTAALAQPARPVKGLPNVYGAGQPSALLLDGKVYLAFTDTGAKASNPVNGAGIYVWRSSDPTFNTGVEVLAKTGWEARTAQNIGTYSPVHAFSVDWMFSDVMQQFVMVANYSNRSADLHTFDRNMKRLANAPYGFPAPWRDGPAIVTRSNGHAIRRGNACDAVPVDLVGGIVNSTTDQGPNGWDIGWSGIDLRTDAVDEP